MERRQCRYKDFYDIYVLADRYNLDGMELKEAVRETFEHRETGFDDICAFTDGFITSKIHQRRWKAFLKKKKACNCSEPLTRHGALSLYDIFNFIRDKNFAPAATDLLQREFLAFPLHEKHPQFRKNALVIR
ncbi:MAG: nucleotidyl transferase AbiEii/AbiGii toxin family protein [Lachnospiraceae bacterium]|nr:nucleotidyl transferase AbiEii/AbiGii toxin family protein [Lachnospiraceae bacterium]